MFYVIHRRNHPQLTYRGGQGPILHLEADLHEAAAWADAQNRRWAFTTSNAGSFHFEDYADISKLDKVDWNAVKALDWRDVRDEKQAEFLLERSFAWDLIARVGVSSRAIYSRVVETVRNASHRPLVEIKPDWYY